MNGRNPDRGTVSAEADLHLLIDLVDALDALAGSADDDTVEEAVRYDFSIRWGTAMSGRLLRLAYYSDRGDLSTADHCRYERLCVRLEQALPQIERFRLAHPRYRWPAAGAEAPGKN